MDMLFYLLRLKYTVLFLLIAIHCGSSPSLLVGVIYINCISLLGFNVQVCGIWCSSTDVLPRVSRHVALRYCYQTLMLNLLPLFDLRPAVKCCRWGKKWTVATRSGSRCFHLKGMLSEPVVLLLAPCSAACLYYSESKQALFFSSGFFSHFPIPY